MADADGDPGFASAASRSVWEARYRRPGEHRIEETWRRVARAVAGVEAERRELWEERFFGVLCGFAFLPGGRILAAAGTELRVTLGGALRRPHQPPQQPLVSRAPHRRQPLRRGAPAPPRRLRPGIAQPGALRRAPVLPQCPSRPGGLEVAAQAMRTVCHAAYRTSIALAAEKGSFPDLEREGHVAGEFVRALPRGLQEGIAVQGIRNSHLTAIAPTGSVSLLAGNVSSGLEPLFDLRYRRRILAADGSPREFEMTAYALRHWRQTHGAAPPPAHLFVTAASLPATAHLQMQAALQPYVDQAIAKTVNVPAATDFASFRDLFSVADACGLKGLTVFRPNPVTGEVLRPPLEEACCPLSAAAAAARR